LKYETQIVFFRKYLAEKDNQAALILFEFNILEAIEKQSFFWEKRFEISFGRAIFIIG